MEIRDGPLERGQPTTKALFCGKNLIAGEELSDMNRPVGPKKTQSRETDGRTRLDFLRPDQPFPLGGGRSAPQADTVSLQTSLGRREFGFEYNQNGHLNRCNSQP